MSIKSYPKPKLWVPKNPEKYQGDSSNIWVRSSWELRVYKWMDQNPNVISWSSEEVVVPYLSPIDNKWHRYFPDVIAKIKTKNKVVVYMVEIKPYYQTVEPEPKKKVTKTYINEVYTWGINSAKWKYAKDFCRERGWEFKILTEKELF